MSNRDLQIFECAKQGLTAAEIAEALGYNVEDVETILLTNPEIVKGLQKMGVAVEVSDNLNKAFEALEEPALKVLKELLLEGEKETVRMAAVDLIMRQRHGLLRPKHQEVNTINVTVFNDRMNQVKQRRKQMEERAATDIECAVVKAA